MTSTTLIPRRTAHRMPTRMTRRSSAIILLGLIGATSACGTSPAETGAPERRQDGVCAPTSEADAQRTSDSAARGKGQAAVQGFGGQFPRATTTEILKNFEAAGVYEVVSRQEAIAVARGPQDFGARSSSARSQAEIDRENFSVVRPTRLALDRSLIGTLADCLDLDLPGGVTDLYDVSEDGFPPEGVTRGDRAIVFFVKYNADSPQASLMLKADDKGNVRLPFGDREVVNIESWNPPKSSVTPQATASAGK